MTKQLTKKACEAMKAECDAIAKSMGFDDWNTGGHIYLWGISLHGFDYTICSWDQRFCEDLYGDPNGPFWSASRTSEEGFSDEDEAFQDASSAFNGQTMREALQFCLDDAAKQGVMVLDGQCG